MDWWWQAIIILGMFMLRLAVPLAVVLLVGYWLRRLDERWQAEAQTQQAEYQAQPEPVKSPLLRQLDQPCWVVKGCDEATRARCVAWRQPHRTCWLARRSPEGYLPEPCYDCPVFLYGQLGRPLLASHPL
ncbi:MAG: hypothetical protein DPW09_12910 [Anaerolineae bacterium]|nr:hypothetical protein [Anaerolineales bacterium]MCQ3974340.1 hypothetical protein [Anaerolineae bacterium]